MQKVPNSGTGIPLAATYCSGEVCKVGLHKLVQVCVEQRLSLAPVSASNTNVLPFMTKVTLAGLSPGTE